MGIKILLFVIILFLIVLLGITYNNEPEKSLERRDDGAHEFKTNNYFEWWYFDGDLDNNHNFIASLWESSTDGNISYFFELSVYNSTDKVVDLNPIFDSKDVEIRDDSFYIKMGGNYAYEEDGKYYLNFSENNIKMNLKMEPLVDGFGAKKESSDKVENIGIFWVVPVPRGNLSGSLVIDDNEFNISGLGYHDHNWGTNYTANKVDMKKWYWGRVFTDNFTLVYVNTINAVNVSSSSITILRDDYRSIHLYNKTFEYSNITRLEENGMEYPQNIRIFLEDMGNVELQLSRVFDYDISHIRFLYEAEIDLIIANMKYEEYGKSSSEIVELLTTN